MASTSQDVDRARGFEMQGDFTTGPRQARDMNVITEDNNKEELPSPIGNVQHQPPGQRGSVARTNGR